MRSCICCQNALLRHIRHHDVYWYCPRCRQDMPNVDGEDAVMTLHAHGQLKDIDVLSVV